MIRIAAIADLHCRDRCPARYRDWYQALNDEADVFVIAGDLTHFGTSREARALVEELQVVRIPVLAVLGNHDFQSERVDEVKQTLRGAGVWLLEDGPREFKIDGSIVGFAGTKGFCGGYGTSCLMPFGEPEIKALINHTNLEAERLHRDLDGLKTDYRIVVLHYAPIVETLLGEPLELYPFLGSSLLEVPIEELGADLVIHGHAHHGVEVGRTPRGIPVRNVSLPVLKKYYIVYELGD